LGEGRARGHALPAQERSPALCLLRCLANSASARCTGPFSDRELAVLERTGMDGGRIDLRPEKANRGAIFPKDLPGEDDPAPAGFDDSSEQASSLSESVDAKLKDLLAAIDAQRKPSAPLASEESRVDSAELKMQSFRAPAMESECDRARRRRGHRGRARRTLTALRVADRLGHAVQHERQRGALEPRHSAPRRGPGQQEHREAGRHHEQRGIQNDDEADPDQTS
jgi:hypothetical protein